MTAEFFTALTDFVLVAFCFLSARTFARSAREWTLQGPLILFVGFALAAFAGGIWHGFFSARQDLAQAIVWWFSMLFTGVTAAGLALIGVELLGATRMRPIPVIVAASLAIYAALSWFDPRFLISLIATVLGTLLCVAGLLRNARAPGSMLVLGGLGVSIVAAIAQQRGVALDPQRFDHNATYHVLLLPALWLIYAGLRRLSSRAAPVLHQAMP